MSKHYQNLHLEKYILGIGFVVLLIFVVANITMSPKDRTYFKIIQTDGSTVVVHTDDVDNAIRNNNGVLNLSDLIVEREQ